MSHLKRFLYKLVENEAGGLLQHLNARTLHFLVRAPLERQDQVDEVRWNMVAHRVPVLLALVDAKGGGVRRLGRKIYVGEEALLLGPVLVESPETLGMGKSKPVQVTKRRARNSRRLSMMRAQQADQHVIGP